MKKRIIITLIISATFKFFIFSAQIKGTVKSIYNELLAGVKIIEQDSGSIFFSDSNGSFLIPIPNSKKEVVLSFESDKFHPQTLRVSLDRNFKSIKVLLVPKEHLREEVSVTALNYKEESVSVPTAESTVSELEIKEKISENIVSALLETPGIYFIGKGGLSITPSIRGLARRRILILVDGARITSDRRAGTSASFVPPEMVKKIEVVRSSSSVLYGSDAIGGIVHIMTKSSLDQDLGKNTINLNLNSINQRINTGFTLNQKLGTLNICSGFQYTQAGNYRSPNREIYHSGYSYLSGILDLSFKSKKRNFSLGYIGGYGKNIGKPDNKNDPNKYTVNPVNKNHLIKFLYNDNSLINNGTINLSLYLSPTIYKLTKIDLYKNESQHSNTKSLNYIFKLNLKKKISDYFSYQIGTDWFLRRNINMENTIEEGNKEIKTFPLKDGKRSDLGMFFVIDYSGIPTFDIMGGIRYTFFSLSAKTDKNHIKKQSNAPSAFLGITKKLGKTFSTFVNIGRAFRLPSISESFYTGITGRNYVIGNPNLKPENGFNIDVGLKYFSKNIFVGFYLFSYYINNMIERYLNNNIYTYNNINRGNIYGGEIEFQFFLKKNIELFGHYFCYRGRSTTHDLPLNDVPSRKLFLGGKFFFNRLWAEINYIHSFKKDDPGPAEVINNTFDILNIKSGFYFSSSFFIYMKLSNVFNNFFYANPDPNIPEDKGFGFSSGIYFNF